MTPNKTGRGRPKGTGLNDAAQLRAIAGLMATNPDLKPTTAIKTLGITDPSVIRRLRDKFSAVESQLVAEIAPRLPLGDDVAKVAAPAAQPCAAAPGTALCHQEAIQAAVEATAQAAIDIPRNAARAMPLTGARAERKIQAARVVVPEAAPFVPTPVPPRAERSRHFPLPSETGLNELVGMGLSMYALSVEAQFAVVGLMFQWPPLAAVLKSQVAFSEVAVAMTRSATGSSRQG